MINWWELAVFANGTISIAYMCITVFIVVPLVRLHQLWSNKLATTTAMIFFSCSVGHGMHAVEPLLGGGTGMDGRSMGTWWLALWHTFTAVVAVYYVTLRRFYGRLLTTPRMFDDLVEQQRLHDLEAFQAEVTARTEAEEDRDHYAAMLKSINNNSHSMIYVKDLEGRYLMVNTAFAISTGMTEAELIGRTDEAINAELAPLWRNADLRAQQGPFRSEEVNQHEDGLRYFDSTKFPLFDGNGKMYATCGISTNITESKLANAALTEARDVALAATAAKSAFLATMSHEIRTPMNAVIGMTDLLLDTDLDEQQHEFLDTVRSSGDALLAVINDILDFSKIESGELRLVNVGFRLRDEVEGTLDFVAGAATAKGLDLVCYVDDSCPVRVVGDASHLRQILINLLSNAVKFTATGEVLMTVTARPADEERVSVTIGVTDSGIGISADGVAKLFRSFSQVDDSATRAYGGTGLGLVISKRLAQAMDGDVTVTSIPGEGTTFTVTVVLEACESGDEDADALAPILPLVGVSVLIVDDNLTNLRILDLQLTSLEMHTTTASSPAEALSLVADGLRYDLAVVDMNMPDMDGIELARRLRSAPDARPSPIILLTSMGSRPPQSDVELVAILAKPVKSATLRAALTSALRGGLTTSDETRFRPQSVEPASQPLRILLAEDNPVNQRVAQLMLDKLGHRVETVDNGRNAVEAAAASAYDVVLMDVQMPGMDGLEATRRIRAQLPAEEQPHIIAMTASALLEDQEACSAAGMENYLTKPVRVQELRAMLNRVAATIRSGGDTRRAAEVASRQGRRDEQMREEPAALRTTVSRTEEQPPVDGRLLDQLGEDLTDTDGSLVDELIEKFLDTGTTTMAALAAASAAGRPDEVARLAHSVTASSELLGALPLTGLLRQLHGIDRDRPEKISAAVAAAAGEYGRVADYLRQRTGAGLLGPVAAPED